MLNGSALILQLVGGILEYNPVTRILVTSVFQTGNDMY